MFVVAETIDGNIVISDTIITADIVNDNNLLKVFLIKYPTFLRNSTINSITQNFRVFNTYFSEKIDSAPILCYTILERR